VPLPNATPLAPILAMLSCTTRNLLLDANAPSRAMVDGDGGGVDIGGSNWLMETSGFNMRVRVFGPRASTASCETAGWAIRGATVLISTTSAWRIIRHQLTAYNNFVRGAGDDGVTINSVNTNESGTITYTEMMNTTLSNNTTVAIWWAHGVGVYGGINDVVKDNLTYDPAKMTGIFITEFGENGSTLDSALVQGNVVVRGGGNAFNQQQPAFSVGGSSSRPYIANVVVISNTIIDAMYSGAGIESCSNVVFQGNTSFRRSLTGSPFLPARLGAQLFIPTA